MAAGLPRDCQLLVDSLGNYSRDGHAQIVLPLLAAAQVRGCSPGQSRPA